MNGLIETLHRFGGIATRRQLIRHGFTGYELTAAVRTGAVARVRQGYYALLDAAPDAIAAVRVGGALGCLSAAASHGIWAGTDTRVHVSVPRNACRLRTRTVRFNGSDELQPDTVAGRIQLHWGIDDRPLVHGSAPCWRVPLAQSLRELAMCADDETAIAAWDTALDSRKVSPAEIERLRDSLPESVQEVLRQVCLGSGSGVESLVKQRLRACGLDVQQQVFIAGVGRVDLLVGDRVIVEIDGYAYHSSPERFENDRRRDALLVAAGYIVVRLSYRQVMEEWDFCLNCVMRALVIR